MDTGLQSYRKVIAMAVTAALVFGLNRAGITGEVLASVGLDIAGMQETITELLVQVAIPAVIVAAQPNEAGQSLWRDWWHWIVGGLAVVAILIAAVALVA